MLSPERVKEPIGDKNVSDEEDENIRNDLYELVEIIFKKYLMERKAK